MGLIDIDAHADTAVGKYQGDELSDAAVFRNAVLDQAIDPERTIQIGMNRAIMLSGATLPVLLKWLKQ